MYRIRSKKIFFDNRRIWDFFFLTEWLTDSLIDKLDGWLIYLWHWIPPTEILTLCINTAVDFTSLKSGFFFQWNSLLSKTTWVFYFPRNAFKIACIGLHIDTNVHFHRHIFRGEFVKPVDFSRNSRHFAHFWELNFQIYQKLKIAFKK